MPVWSDTLLPAVQTEHDVEIIEAEQLESSNPPIVHSAELNGHGTASGLSHDDPISLVDQSEAMRNSDAEEHSAASVEAVEAIEAQNIEYLTVIQPLEHLALAFLRRCVMIIYGYLQLYMLIIN